MTLDDLRLQPDERGAIIGQTGTGKSFLAKRLLPETGGLAIIDPKRMFDYCHNVRLYTSAEAVLRQKPDRFIYRPEPDDFTNLLAYNEIYRYCYERGNLTVYTDDMVGVMDKTSIPHYLKICYQMGRAKKVACLSAFQRPAWVPAFLYTESCKFYVFRLNMDEDIKRVHSFVTGYDPRALGSKHEFAYQDIYTMDGAERSVLRVETKPNKEEA